MDSAKNMQSNYAQHITPCWCCQTYRTSALSHERVVFYRKDTQLVDPASVYMLVSKTKPCMPKYSSVG